MKIDLSTKAKSQAGSTNLSTLLGGAPTPGVTQLPMGTLVPYPNQPFRPYSEEKLELLANDIRMNGVLSPIIVRARDERYEILAGHNRWSASKRAGKNTIPAIVMDVDDDTAALIMVNTNLNQRDELLPSEKAFAYKVQLEAMKRRAGRPQGNLSQLGTQKRSDQEMAELVGESRNQIQRYIRLTFLIPDLLEQVDAGQLAVVPAVSLSYLSTGEQELVLSASADLDRKISIFQADQLKSMSANATEPLDEEQIQSVLLPTKNWNPQQDFVTQSRSMIPKTASPQDVTAVLQLIENYFRKKVG